MRGHAASLDQAIAKFGMIVSPIATMAGFVANVRVGPLEVHLAYDCTVDHTERQFLETFLPGRTQCCDRRSEHPPASDGRACMAFVALKTDGSRISRALRQYELALREWYLGGEWLALSHL